MTESVLDVLDRAPTGEAPGAGWTADVERSLADAPDAWVAAVAAEGLSKDRAWVLLSWVEDAASRLVRERRRDLVERAAFAMSLLEASPLDRRDVMVVAMLVRRGTTLAGLPFDKPVSRGCARAGELGTRCEQWLLRITDATPSTHEEVGEGRDLRFVRRPTSIDPDALLARFGRKRADGGDEPA